MPNYLNSPLPHMGASSAITNINLLNTMGSNILNSSGTLSSSSAALYGNQILQASSTMAVMLTRLQQGLKISS
jgi:hypothetical protein